MAQVWSNAAAFGILPFRRRGSGANSGEAMSVEAPGKPAAEPRVGLLHDPLADWSNDDILLTKPARAALSARHLASLRVLDWPELRALFARHDMPAKKSGRADRRLGFLSVLTAASCVIVAAATPLAGPLARWVGSLAALLAVAAVALALLRRADVRANARWLAERYWTERVRSLYFQTIVNNLGLVADAMRDDTALGRWKVTRATALKALPEPEDVTSRVPRLAGPVAEEETWISPDWRQPPPTPAPSEELDTLLALLRSQRFDVQLAYSDAKLSDSLRAPARRSAAVRRGSQVLPALAVGAAGAAGVMLASGAAVGDVGVRLALAAAAAAMAAALALKMLNEDLRLSDDAARYAWYSAAVTRARARFDAGGLAEKVAALREMEVIAYRDLREFVAAHWRARHAP
jgi:hypothetical protein